MISILIASLVSIIYSTAIFGLSHDTDTHSLTLESHNREHERARKRQLIYDTGNNRQCFDVNYNRGYEDYFNNPFLANHNRGDWGKCMPELLFSALCIHEDIEKLNDGSWQVSDGPLHEAPSEKMFLALKSLHSSQCLHIDIEFSTLLKEKLNDYFFARNEFAISTTNYTSNTYSFVVTVANGKFFVNGKSSPVLTLTKGSTYSFFMGVNAYAMNPFLIGTSVGTPYAPVYLTDEYDMKKVKFTIPFNAPRTLVYYSSNATAVGNNIISQDPVQLSIVPRGGVFYINDQPQPTLTLTVGVTYTFVVKNSDQQLFPFAFGTATNAPYLTSSAITVTEGSYATRFTVLFRDSSVTSLVYYCLNNPFMTGGINIVSGSRRQLASTNEDVQGTSTCNGNYLNPRAAIRKSLYCLFSDLAQSLPTALTQKPYAVSNTCDQIARSYLTSSIYYPPVWPPLQYCDQAPVPAVDSCTVIANVNFWTNQGRTCKDYCEAFPGLTCAAAAAPEWHYIKPHWQPQCMARRQWSCTTPQTAETYLLCTCASKAQLSGSITPPINTYAPTVSPSSSFTASPSLAKSSPTAATSRSSAAPTRTVRPSVSPSSAPTTTRPSAAPSRAPTTTRPSVSLSKAPTTSARPSVKPTRTPTVKPVLVKRVFLHEVEEKLQTQEQKNVQVDVGVPTIVPSPASVVVPTQFNFLRGKCITARDQGFSYPTCFFKNVTQTNWWFTANIGYFGKQINANSFAIYGGDLCGSTNRGGKVILSCGATVSSVTVESPSCYYTLNFTSPQFCISPSYYSAPSASPVTLNPPGQYITPACLALLSGDVYQPNTFCSQDTLMDTCTTVVNNWVGGAQNGSCSQYCGRHGLQCVSAYRNWGCMTYQRLSCSDVTTDYTMSCQCGQPISNAVVVANPNLNTQSCQQIMFNNWVNLKPDKFCPRNLIVSTSQDSCTVWRNSYNQVSCDTFCSNYPGLKCLSAAVGDPSTCAVHANYYGAPPLSCSAIPPQYNTLLCTCGVDSSSMPAVVAAASAPMSNACINIMTQPEPFASFDRLCRSDPIANTCQVSVHTNTYLTPLTCSQYCAQYSGMRCVDAQFANGDLQRCTVNQNSQFPKPSCDLNMMDHTALALCTCGFAPSAPQQNKFMLSHFDPNRPYCPAYPANVDSYNISSLPTSRRRLDDWSDVYGYERYYKKIVVGVDYNTAKADGSVKVTNVKTSWDRSDWRIDSYNTNTPEMCTGLESRIRPGDPPGKCSFGNRPNNSAASDCLGKLYSMNYKEASNKCKARGGRLAQVDTPQKLRDLYNLYVHDEELSIGLKDVGGQNWQWDGPSNIQVPATWLNSTIPYKPYLGTHWAYADCIIIRFNRQSQTYAPYFTTASCDDKRTYICQGISNPATPGIGGDLLADEGGFCLWYYGNPTISLPDDQSANFRNTELAHFLLTSPIQSTSKYELLYNQLYSYHIPGHPENLANWKSLTRKQVGQNSDLPVFPPNSFNHSFHCHFSPTNFGIARIYGQQHMLERLYSGAAHLHCFCGFKNLGKLVDRCDCTRSGETNNNCLTEHRKILYEETYRQTGEYVSCNNCNNPSP